MNEVTITMPLTLTSEMIRAVRDDPSTCTAGRDDWHARLGWLLCAWDVLVQHGHSRRHSKPRGLPARVLGCIADGETLTNAEFKARIAADGPGGVIAEKLNTTLHRMAKSGRLEYVGYGKYRKIGQASTLDAGAEKD